MKIGSFSGGAKYDKTKPIEFEVSMPDHGHVVDANIVLGHHTAHLHLRVVHDVADKTVPVKMLALLDGHEHDDVREFEFVMRTRAAKFTSDVAPYYLFTSPRKET